MNCDHFRKHLTDLVTRDGDRADDAELLLHASQCGPCSQELEESRQTVLALKPSRKLTASERLKEKTMKQIYDMTTGAATWPVPVVSPAAKPRRRTWIYALGAATVTVAIVVAMLSSSPTIAFSQVVQKLVNARALTIRGTISLPGEAPIPTVTRSIAPNLFRWDIGESTTMIADYRKKQGISLLHDTKSYVTVDLSTVSESAKAIQQGDIVQKLKSLASAGVPVERRNINGRAQQGFKASDAEGSFLIWADPSTGEIASAEYEVTGDAGGRGVMEEFIYEDTMDESLFSLAPPGGYTSMLVPAIATADVPAAPSEAKFIEFLGEYARSSDNKQFPSTLNAGTLVRELADSSKREKLSIPELRAKVKLRGDGTIFPHTLKPDNHFQYAGKGVTFGTSQTAIAWYRPTGSTSYRVIYADLQVREVAADKLPASN